MAMARISVTVCDECGAQDDILSYEIRQGDRRAQLDLCPAHAAFLEQMMGKVAPTSGSAQSARTRQPRRRSRAMTMEEIEALKKSK